MLKYIINNDLIDQDKAVIGVFDTTLLRGYGIFDFFRLEGHIPLFIDDHLDRFYRSAEFLRLTPPLTKTQLKVKINEMLLINQLENSGVRLLLTGGQSPNGFFPGNPTLIVINEPMSPPDKNQQNKGIKLVSLEYQRDLPEVKSINYLIGIYNWPKVLEANAHDLLYVSNGFVSELTRSNFFIVNENDIIITPKTGILKGINRMKLIELCHRKYSLEERPVSWEEVIHAKEAFITGTSKKITPVIQIDCYIIANGKPGPITRQLQKQYDQMIENYVKQHAN